jgi:hypothetical protein
MDVVAEFWRIQLTQGKPLREKFCSAVMIDSDCRNRQAFALWSDRCDASVVWGLLISGNIMTCVGGAFAFCGYV